MDVSKPLTYAQAVEMLPPDGRIHTFVNPVMGTLIGADWDREEVLKLLEKPESKILIAGDAARGINHGLVIVRKKEGSIFIQTREGLTW